MKKKIIFFLSLIGILLISLGVDAGNYDDYIVQSNYISRIYFRKEGPGGFRRYQQARFLRRVSDGAFVYCVEPMVLLEAGVLYDSFTLDHARTLNITEETWQRISLIAYFGYGYGNHQEDKWYAITQLMIWREVAPYMDVYFTSTLNGSRAEIYLEEMAEINNLIYWHRILPNFISNEFNIDVGESIEITDYNNILSEYNVILLDANVSIVNTGHSLIIKGIDVGTSKVILQKLVMNSNYTLRPILYYHTSSQKVFAPGKPDALIKNINVNVHEVIIPPKIFELKVIKIDEDTKDAINQKDIKFKLTNTLNDESFIYETNEYGYFIVSELLSGTYILEELEAPIGYELSDEILIEINEENEDLMIIVEFKNKKIFVPEELQFEFPKTYVK